MKCAPFLLVVIVFTSFSFSQSESLKVPVLKLGAITVANSRTAGETAAPNPAAMRFTVAHGSSVAITVENVGVTRESVTVCWFAVGRYATSKNFFRNGDGEKTLVVQPKSSQDFVADFEVDSHDTSSSKGSYRSGGKLVGWVVMMYDSKGNFLSSTASDTYLEEFAAKPPPLQRK